MNHDQLFKRLLKTFLWEFADLFLPDLAAMCDPSSIDFMEQEQVAELVSQSHREVDLVARVRLKGEEAFFLIHVEHEAQDKGDFPRRMFRYFSLLHDRHDLPVYPIALFSHKNSKKPQAGSYKIQFPGFEVLCFQFRVVQLNRLDWRDYLRKSNPVAAALMSRMRIQTKDRPLVKSACLRLLAGLELDGEKKNFVSAFIDYYLRLDSEEEQIFLKEIESLETKEKKLVLELTTSWKEEGRVEGREEGREEGRVEGRLEGRVEGRVEGRRDAVIVLLESRFGSLPSDLTSHLDSLTAEELLNLVPQAGSVSSLEEFSALVRGR